MRIATANHHRVFSFLHLKSTLLLRSTLPLIDSDLFVPDIVLELHKQSKRPISIDLLVDGARICKLPGIDAGNNLSWDASTMYVKRSVVCLL